MLPDMVLFKGQLQPSVAYGNTGRGLGKKLARYSCARMRT